MARFSKQRREKGSPQHRVRSFPCRGSARTADETRRHGSPLLQRVLSAAREWCYRLKRENRGKLERRSNGERRIRRGRRRSRQHYGRERGSVSSGRRGCRAIANEQGHEEGPRGFLPGRKKGYPRVVPTIKWPEHDVGKEKSRVGGGWTRSSLSAISTLVRRHLQGLLLAPVNAKKIGRTARGG